MTLSSEDEMRAAFRVFDLDGNGLIDSEELQLTMSQLGEQLTASDVSAMIRAVDRNNDGKVDYEGHCQASVFYHSSTYLLNYLNYLKRILLIF